MTSRRNPNYNDSRNQDIAFMKSVAIEYMPRDLWTTKEGRDRLKELAMVRWHKTPAKALEYAEIVQAELLHDASLEQAGRKKENPLTIPAEAPDPLTLDAEAMMSAAEIVAAYRRSLPPVKPADFAILDEEGSP